MEFYLSTAIGCVQTRRTRQPLTSHRPSTTSDHAATGATVLTTSCQVCALAQTSTWLSWEWPTESHLLSSLPGSTWAALSLAKCTHQYHSFFVVTVEGAWSSYLTLHQRLIWPRSTVWSLGLGLDCHPDAQPSVIKTGLSHLSTS